MIGAGATGKTEFGLPTISLNWSGYAVTGKKPYNYVSSRYVVPTVKCNGMKDVYTSDWVGLDGFNDGTVEQDGISGFCTKRSDYKLPYYYAWIEMYPAPTVVAYQVRPGDSISASVLYTTNGNFTLTVTDVTSGQTSTTVATCSSCERASAEWIIERPAGCNPYPTNCFLFALANFGFTKMADDVASQDGGNITGLAKYPNAHQIYMVQNTKAGGFYALDAVGPVTAAKNAFTVKWLHYGKVTPIQLGPAHAS
jgi:Peptidase A4 family